MAQTLLDFADTDSPLDGDGFAIGWAHAQHGIVPPVEHLASASPVRQGWQAGRAAFARRTLPATPAVRQWLQLRLQAWREGLAFEAVQVTPHYLKQLAVTHCPVTRDALDGDATAVIERVRRDAGIAAGNLALLAERVAAARDGGAPLDERQARRLAVLESFVTPLPHAEACALPLLVLPPNRVRLFNPVQALQALATRLLIGEGFAQRASRLEALLPGDAAQRAFRRFVHALLPRVLTLGKSPDGQTLRWALEDAWHDPLVMARWHRFALLLTPEPLATEGWALDDFGLARSSEPQPRRRPPQQQSAAEQVALPL